MSTEVAVRQQTTLTNDQLGYISKTEFVPPGLRGNLPAILACVATGRELGIGDMVSLKSIHIIDGKATFSAELMVQLVRRAGHSIVGEVSDGSATVTGTRIDNGDEMTSTWTLQMAERAGLVGKANWVKYPEAMLWARAASQLCRMLFPDCFAGATYTPEELEDGAIETVVVRTRDSSDERAVSHSGEAEARVPADGGSDDQDPGMGARTPDPLPLLSSAQAKKLDVLVGKLRSAGHITTEQLYTAVGLDAEASEHGADGLLHWAPLRESLTKQQASDLIERLEKLEPSPLAKELLALLPADKHDDALARITAHRDDPAHNQAEHARWLSTQIDRAKEKAVA